MSDTAIDPIKKPTPTDSGESEDTTELVLWTWGLSGEPVTWASTEMQPVIVAVRAVNTGFGDASAVQTMLDACYPEMGYEAANVCLAHPPTAEFRIASGDIDPDVDPDVDSYLDIIRVDLVDDEDLDLPNELVTWDFGDGTAVAHDLHGWEHGYTAAGTYQVSCTVAVAGVLYGTAQDHVVGEPPEPAEQPLAVEYAERPATVFVSETDDLPNTSVLPADEPADDTEAGFDPGAHTVAEVKEYLAEHPEEMDAVLAAEEAGKARSGILDL